MLNGMSLDRAVCYGVPHLGAHYETDNVNSHTLDEGAYCAVCGRPAAHAHHEPPKGIGAGSAYLTIEGNPRHEDGRCFVRTYRIRPSLIALCAQCHADRHSGLLAINWEFDDDWAQSWLDGALLDMGIHPHSDELFDYGKWLFWRNGNLIREIRYDV